MEDSGWVAICYMTWREANSTEMWYSGGVCRGTCHCKFFCGGTSQS